jgi:hypothetical protein
MSKHTPGPWSVDAEDVDLFAQETHRIWINADGMHICYVDGPRNPERNANARLIAAAPDLLEAFDRVQDAIQNFLEEGLRPTESVMRFWQADVRAAIAKATGGEE